MKPSTMLKIIAVSISMAILTACASTGSHSNPKVGTPEQSHDYLQSKPLQTLLKSSLNPQDYAGLNANLKQFSTPFALKEGSKYYEARDDNTSTASAIVVTPQQLFYLAYQLPNSHDTVYITNDVRCQTTLHPGMQIFNHVYPKDKLVNRPDYNRN